MMFMTKSPLWACATLLLIHAPDCRAFSSTSTLLGPGLAVCSTSTSLQMSLKPLALPLMESGKALARGGEFIVDATQEEYQIYGGAFSACGASIRNAGDSIAQAAASCRFKTGVELVIDELREASTCLVDAEGKMKKAVEEADVILDEKEIMKKMERGELILPMEFGRYLEQIIPALSYSNQFLESAGANILKRQSLSVIGNEIVQASIALYNLAEAIYNTAEIEGQRGSKEKHNLIMASERIQYASQKMNEAGEALMNSSNQQKKNIKGKGWIKGGL